MDRNCVFCKIVRGELPSYVVYRDDDVIVFLDIFPVEKGHLLVVPLEHYESIADSPPQIVAKVFTVAAAYARLYRKKLGAPGVNVIANSGKPAGQEIFHFHVHVIPRWRGGGWRSLFARHRLTREEALEVISLLEKYNDFISSYVKEATRL